MTRLVAALLSVIVIVTLADLSWAADAVKGEAMARRWCVACHVVAKDQTSGGMQAPTFAAIAARSDFDAGKLALFLLLPHPRMPDMNMSRAEAADLAAYIASQR